ncbi:MAG: hypothetical protein ACI9OJ_004869, partial [Myxococcota bacterium]
MKSQLQLPPLQEGAASWYGPDMAAREDEWLMPLSGPEIAELEVAAEPLVRGQINIGSITSADFPLPFLAPKL